MLLSKCEVSHRERSKFIKDQKPSGLLSRLGIKTAFSKIPLVGPLFF